MRTLPSQEPTGGARKTTIAKNVGEWRRLGFPGAVAVVSSRGDALRVRRWRSVGPARLHTGAGGGAVESRAKIAKSPELGEEAREKNGVQGQAVSRWDGRG